MPEGPFYKPNQIQQKQYLIASPSLKITSPNQSPYLHHITTPDPLRIILTTPYPVIFNCNLGDISLVKTYACASWKQTISTYSDSWHKYSPRVVSVRMRETFTSMAQQISVPESERRILFPSKEDALLPSFFVLLQVCPRFIFLAWMILLIKCRSGISFSHSFSHLKEQSQGKRLGTFALIDTFSSDQRLVFLFWVSWRQAQHES